LATDRVERRLAAILAADVAGYSRLMGADEEGTLAALKAVRRELSDPKVKEHRGRIVKTTGDGLLIEFASVVDAVRCAVEVQRAMAERNSDVPPDRRIELRMGINLGDIIKDGRDIYGDGVNVAARLEALAEPGGICVSRVVRDQVRDKLAFAFEDMGEQQVKNIARPVRVHRVRLFEDQGFPTVHPSDKATAAPLANEKALHPDTILAWAQNGQLLEHLHGAPLRLLVPGWSGNWSVKWLTTLELTEQEPDCWYHYQFYYYGNSLEDPQQRADYHDRRQINHYSTKRRH